MISATNKDLEAAVEDGSFRKDLYYRLNVFSITVPPLKERREDIPPLAEHFLKKYCRSMSKRIEAISPEAMALLEAYDWPGNVRELENAVERAVVVCKGDILRPSDFQFTFSSGDQHSSPKSLQEMERQHIEKVLQDADWNISFAAKILDIDRVTLYNKIKKYDLKRR